MLGLPLVVAAWVVGSAGTQFSPLDGWKVPLKGRLFVGGLLAVVGLRYRWQAWQQHLSSRARTQTARTHPANVALADYAWDIRGFEAPRWKEAIRQIGLVTGLTAVLSMCTYVAFFDPRWSAVAEWPLLGRIVAVVVDLAVAFGWYSAVLRLQRTVRFGRSRILFERFPYRLSEPMVSGGLPPHVSRQHRGHLLCGASRNPLTILVRALTWCTPRSGVTHGCSTAPAPFLPVVRCVSDSLRRVTCADALERTARRVLGTRSTPGPGGLGFRRNLLGSCLPVTRVHPRRRCSP